MQLQFAEINRLRRSIGKLSNEIDILGEIAIEDRWKSNFMRRNFYRQKEEIGFLGNLGFECCQVRVQVEEEGSKKRNFRV
jgi:hypothetical protein